MFDVFYYGTKPNLFAHEQQALDVDHARELSATRYFWWVNYLTDYTGHDFLWEPVAWESEQTHVWPSQHQATGGTLLCPKIESQDRNYNHTKLIRNRSVPVVGIDHGTGLTIACSYTTRYISDYLGTLRRVLNRVEAEYVWVVSSVCDYSQFDFTWHPSEWQQDMLHVFASDEQRFGDTFYVHVASFLAKTKNLKILEWFDTLHFVPDISVPRCRVPQIKYTQDTIVDAIWRYEFKEPVVHLYRDDLADNIPAVNLWQASTRTIVSLSEDNSQAVVPRDAKNYLRTQAYDYPYIDKSRRKSIASELQDIIFISYDEPDAEGNWQILSDRFPRAKRVDGVAGMEQALEAAANASTTPWYFAVFAKTQLYDAFDFTFVPDYFQQPKHYIFNSLNTVNGLEYGHMGIVMYNCAGIRTINQSGEFGLDYTMSFPNETIPVLSCIGAFDSTPYHTWRTAFREAGKLAYFESVKPTVDGAYRLDIWSTQATGPYADWCLKGARDGVEFVKDSDYKLDTIKQAFRWVWLRDYFVARYGALE
jgi:hypothetical protein